MDAFAKGAGQSEDSDCPTNVVRFPATCGRFETVFYLYTPYNPFKSTMKGICSSFLKSNLAPTALEKVLQMQRRVL